MSREKNTMIRKYRAYRDKQRAKKRRPMSIDEFCAQFGSPPDGGGSRGHASEGSKNSSGKSQAGVSKYTKQGVSKKASKKRS